MTPPTSDLHEWAVRITDYLRAHPHASDSAEGIARWWLQAPPADWPRVRQALEQMVLDGQLESLTGADGHVRYRSRLATDGSAGG